MAYFIHNKYDANSIAKVTTSDNVNFTYKADSSVTVIDYYGLIERGNTTYQKLDTTSMGSSTISSLTYSDVTISENTTTQDKNSELVFNSSINIKSIQRGTVTAAGTVTISAVDLTKTFLNITGNGSGIMTSATTLNIKVNGGTIAYEVIEFM